MGDLKCAMHPHNTNANKQINPPGELASLYYTLIIISEHIHGKYDIAYKHGNIRK